MASRPFRWNGLLVAYGIIAAALVGAIYWRLAPQGQLEVTKIVVQFLLITSGGAILTAWFTMRREADQRELARQAAVRELAKEVNAGYRRFKKVKRRLRSLIVDDKGASRTAREPPYLFEAEAFEKSMEDLLEAQIAFEIIRDTVQARHDLLPKGAPERIHDALNYAARYFHDVYQDFENGRVARRDGFYEANADCEGLADFVGRQAWCETPDRPWFEAIEDWFKALRDEDRHLEQRYAALQAIIALRKEDKKKRDDNEVYAKTVRPIRRYRIVATEAIGLAFLDIHLALPRVGTRIRGGAAGNRKLPFIVWHDLAGRNARPPGSSTGEVAESRTS